MRKLTLREKEILSHRHYCGYKNAGNKIRAYYWKLRLLYYEKKALKEFINK